MPTRTDYTAYTKGDRSPEARAAKADYMRERRAAARLVAQPRQRIDGIVHGRYGYEELGCRCLRCKLAHG